jgi:hypothetical protein
MAKMTKDQALAHIKALYDTFNMADSDNPNRADWTKPEMAGTCCRPLDALICALLEGEEREAFYATL